MPGGQGSIHPAEAAALVVDRDAARRDAARAHLAAAAVDVDAAGDLADAVRRAGEKAYDVVFVQLAPNDAAALAAALRAGPAARNRATPVAEVEDPDPAWMLTNLERFVPSQPPSFDRQVFLPIAELLPARIGALVDRFEADGAALFAQYLSEAFDQRRRRAHSAKGAARQLGALRLGHLLERLEGRGEDPPATALLGRVQEAYTVAVRAMRAELGGAP